MSKSPLQPLLVTIARQDNNNGHHQRLQQQQQQQEEVDGQVEDIAELSESSKGVQARLDSKTKAPAVKLTFQSEPGAVNADQLADVIKVSTEFSVAVYTLHPSETQQRPCGDCCTSSLHCLHTTEQAFLHCQHTDQQASCTVCGDFSKLSTEEVFCTFCRLLRRRTDSEPVEAE